jgi:uncharacterized membrane protein
MNKKRGITVYEMAAIGLMAAAVFVATNFRIQIPTAIGKTMIHFGNVFCLLAGLLLGGARGGLSAGIGSMFFDLVDPAFISSAPWTLLFKFAMGFTCGAIAHGVPEEKQSFKRNLAGAVSGAMLYVILYVGKNFVSDLVFLRNPMQTVLISVAQKGLVSTFNAIVAVAVSVSVYPAFRRAMRTAGIYTKLFPPVQPKESE